VTLRPYDPLSAQAEKENYGMGNTLSGSSMLDETHEESILLKQNNITSNNSANMGRPPLM